MCGERKHDLVLGKYSFRDNLTEVSQAKQCSTMVHSVHRLVHCYRFNVWKTPHCTVWYSEVDIIMLYITITTYYDKVQNT